jgi:hypothetical protein
VSTLNTSEIGQIAAAGERAAERMGSDATFDAATFAKIAFLTATVEEQAGSVQQWAASLPQKYTRGKALLIIRFRDGASPATVRTYANEWHLGNDGAKLTLRWMAIGNEWIEVVLPGKEGERIVFAIGEAKESDFGRALVTFAGYRFVSLTDKSSASQHVVTRL